jgi:GNAT superfamily N-acetyltransferase
VLSGECARSFALVAVESDAVGALGLLDGAEIKRLYVYPGFQGKGLGRLLIQELEAEARRRGLVCIELRGVRLF